MEEDMRKGNENDNSKKKITKPMLTEKTMGTGGRFVKTASDKILYYLRKEGTRNNGREVGGSGSARVSVRLERPKNQGVNTMIVGTFNLHQLRGQGERTTENVPTDFPWGKTKRKTTN